MSDPATDGRIRRAIRSKPGCRRLPDSDLDDLTQDVLRVLIAIAPRYVPTLASPGTLAETVIADVVVDRIRRLQRHCRDERRTVRLARLAPRHDDHGDESDPPEAAAAIDWNGRTEVSLRDRDEALGEALVWLDEPTRRFAELIMMGLPPRRAGVRVGWSWRQSAAAVERIAKAVHRAGITAGDRP